MDNLFPHVRYMEPLKNYNPSKKYGYYIGTDMSISRRDAFEFYMCSYAEIGEERRDVWVTRDKNGNYIRLEDCEQDWKFIIG